MGQGVVSVDVKNPLGFIVLGGLPQQNSQEDSARERPAIQREVYSIFSRNTTAPGAFLKRSCTFLRSDDLGDGSKALSI